MKAVCYADKLFRKMTNLSTLAREVLQKNDRGGYTVPRPGLYPFQWNWDSSFVSLGFAVIDESRAWEELETLFKGQWANGMVPHIVFHKDDDSYSPGPGQWGAHNGSGLNTSAISNPPVAGISVKRLLKDAEDQDFARRKAAGLFPKLYAWHKWFHEVRDPEGTGLVMTYHPWETGRDNSHDWKSLLPRVPLDNLRPYKRKDTEHVDADQRPDKSEYDAFMALVQFFRDHGFDEAYFYENSPFKIADTTINFILAKADLDLIWVAEHLDADKYAAEIAQLKAWHKVSLKGLERLWDAEQGAYTPLDMKTGKHVKGISSGTFLSFLADLDHKDREHRQIEILESWHEKGLLVPSYDPEHADFEPQRYWMGPVWTVVNYLIYEGLNSCGYDEMARKVAVDTMIALKKGSVSEYFNPLTAEGLGGKDFSWTSALWLYWLAPLQDNLAADYSARVQMFE